MSGREVQLEAVPAAKVTVPRWRAVRRPRLEARLSELWSHGFGLVVAPAGSGKTTLLAQFASVAGVPVAWYRVDPGDVSGEALLLHLQRSTTRALGVDEFGSPWTSARQAAHHLEALSPGGLLMVVDDLHVVHGSAAERTMEQLLSYLPPAVAVVVASRRMPTLNLSRLRVSDSMVELGPEDLRFRSWEVESLFRDLYHQPLPPEMLAELARRTHGWAAGLQLFHLATRGKSGHERGAVLQSLVGGAGPLREYLLANVLQELTTDVREFMVRTSVLGRLTGALCDELLGRRDSSEVLEHLEHRQLFITSLATGGFRYHEVLRVQLEADLVAALGEEGVREQRRRAGRLLEAAGAIGDALQAYSRAGEWAAVARVLGEGSESLIEEPGAWLETLPTGLVEADPWLLLARARRHRGEGRLRQAADDYEMAEKAFGANAAAARCRHERLGILGWLDPPAVGEAAWVSLVREALRKQPRAALVAAERLPGVTGRFAEGVVACLAGQPDRSAELLESVSAEVPSTPLGAAAALLALVAAALGGQPPSAGALQAALEEAEASEVPWLARAAAAATAAWTAPASGQAAPVARAALDGADPWGKAATAFLEGLGRLATPGASGHLARAADALLALDAPVLASWAVSLRAHVLQDDAIATHALRLARSRGVAGAAALAELTLAATRPSEFRQHLVRAEADDREGSIRRLAGHGGDRPAVATQRDDPGPGPRSGQIPLQVQVRCLGAFELSVDDRAVDLAGLKPRARSLLRLLALRSDGVLHREALIDALWPDVEVAAGTRNLQVAISSVRQTLEPGVGRGESQLLRREGDGYQLVVTSDGSDVRRLKDAVIAGRVARTRGDARVAAEQFARALDLYTGDLLPEEGPAEWVVKDREHLRSEAADAAVALAELQLGAGEMAAAAATCERGLRVDPFRDNLWRLLLDAHRRAGDRAAAARTAAAYDAVLAELGVPSQ